MYNLISLTRCAYPEKDKINTSSMVWRAQTQTWAVGIILRGVQRTNVANNVNRLR